MSNASQIVMVSGCLLGIPCRFDGTSRGVPELRSILAGYQLIPFCPETDGGLKTPRPPAEIQGGDGAGVIQETARVINRDGADYTTEFLRGAESVLKLVKKWDPIFVVLKAKSPSCGVGEIYDGTFKGVLKAGDGVTAALLRSAGIRIYTENDLTVSHFGKNS